MFTTANRVLLPRHLQFPLRLASRTMAIKQSYASVASGNESGPDQQPQGTPAPPTAQKTDPTSSSTNEARNRRSPSPSHVPRTSNPDGEVYVLTFLTSAELHKKMTDLRTKYFPPKLNRLDAHLTLFHALPGSKLESDIVPFLMATSASTKSFRLLAATPFKLRHGIAIGVPKSSGGDGARAIHSELKSKWMDFLSDQDAGGFAAHYTIMNKVDRDEEVNDAFADVEDGWRPVAGTVLGFSLWRYERSRWNWQRDFHFSDVPES